MKPLCIAVLCYPGYGGSGVMATELGVALAKRGHFVHFISSEKPFRLSENYARVVYHQIASVKHPVFKDSVYYLAVSAKIVELHACYSFDLVHAHYAVPHAISAYLAREMLSDGALKIVTTLHGTDVTFLGRDETFASLVQFAVAKSHAVTVVSRFLQSQVLEKLSVHCPVDLIYNFVDTQRFLPQKSADFSFTGRVILHLSNFRGVKNVRAVLYCFAAVLKYSACVLVLAGDGPEISLARKLASELQVENNVFFLGAVERVETLLPHADVLLLPSYSESFGLVLLEAMSCGVPTVSSNVGGIPEVVEEGKSGFIFDPEDYRAMAMRIVQIFADENLHASLRKNARYYALHKFSQETILSKYEEVYTRILA